MLNPKLWPDSAQIVGNQLVIGGCGVAELAMRYGTPLYLLCEQTVRATMRSYRHELARHYPGPSRVHYASKALLTTALAQIVAEEGLGLDVVSPAELLLAQRANVPLAHIHVHGNAKSEAELQRALDWQVGAIVVDNLDELHRLAALSAPLSRPQLILLRLAPGIAAATHAHIATGSREAKFGLPLDALDEAAQLIAKAPGLHLHGLHAHIGSQIFDPNELRATVIALADAAARLHEAHAMPISELSPGGGLGVPYTDEMPSLDIAAYAAALGTISAEAMRARNLPLPQLTIEPGRSIIARAGVALYRVIARKPLTRNHEAGALPHHGWLHLDGGMADNIRPALYGARYSAIAANRASEPANARYDLAGRYCESGDVLLRDAALPALAPDDLIAVAVAGAYTLSMASNYNLSLRPALLHLRDGQVFVAQRREREEDLLLRDVALPAPR